MKRKRKRWSVLGLVVAAWLAPAIEAQQPSEAPASRRPAYARRPSSVHHNAFPYPGYYRNDSRGGFRNPGGVGRYEEWYPPGNMFQSGGRDPVPVATFNGGSGVPTFQDQIAAQQLGVQKYNALQQHIDRYARPLYGYPFGVGFFSGWR